MDFGALLCREAERRGLTLPPPGDAEPLAHLDYESERAIKEGALKAFWRAHQLAPFPEPIVPAPQPRAYRTTSKRRASWAPGRLGLFFTGEGNGQPSSQLDPPAHLAVYAFLRERLSRPGARPLASALNYAIVRGRPGALTLILNVRIFDAPVVRGAKQAVEAAGGAGLGLRAASLYLDPTRSEYYLEARRPTGVLSSKRLLGPDWMEVAVGEARLRFPPTVFSQVNEAMLPVMVDAAAELLAPLPGHTLLDLYCGYGLFSLTAGREAESVLGVDHDGPAIEAARRNVERLGRQRAVRFLAGRIDRPLVRDRVPPGPGPAVVLLDPPRQGTEAGVVEAIAARRPERVVHICCGIEEIPRELAAWSRAGYRLRRARPLDLFAGTIGLEVLLQLTRASAPYAIME